MAGLIQGDTPAYGDPERSWPTYSLVGGVGGSSTNYYPDILPEINLRLRREDDEILIILSAILKEL